MRSSEQLSPYIQPAYSTSMLYKPLYAYFQLRLKSLITYKNPRLFQTLVLCCLYVHCEHTGSEIGRHSIKGKGTQGLAKTPRLNKTLLHHKCRVQDELVSLIALCIKSMLHTQYNSLTFLVPLNESQVRCMYLDT